MLFLPLLQSQYFMDLFYEPLVFVPLDSFLRISGGFMKASFFPLSGAFQYSPGPILKRTVFWISISPQLKKLHYCIFQTVPSFLFTVVQYFIGRFC